MLQIEGKLNGSVFLLILYFVFRRVDRPHCVTVQKSAQDTDLFFELWEGERGAVKEVRGKPAILFTTVADCSAWRQEQLSRRSVILFNAFFPFMFSTIKCLRMKIYLLSS